MAWAWLAKNIEINIINFVKIQQNHLLSLYQWSCMKLARLRAVYNFSLQITARETQAREPR